MFDDEDNAMKDLDVDEVIDARIFARDRISTNLGEMLIDKRAFIDVSALDVDDGIPCHLSADRAQHRRTECIYFKKSRLKQLSLVICFLSVRAARSTHRVPTDRPQAHNSRE